MGGPVTIKKRVDTVNLLREELKKSEIIIAPGVFNPLSAMLVERMGFKAVYVSGAAVTASLGLPDIGLITMDEMVRVVKYIVDSIDIPVIVDADTGYGEALNVVRAVREFEKVGASAIQIEDQVLPKKCGHLSGKKLIEPLEMARKIKAAVEARVNPDLIIIARTDARGVNGFQDAVERATLYIEAGADVIFPEALESEEEFIEFAKKVKAPLLANMTEFGRSPILSFKRLEEIGYKLVIYPVTLLRLAMNAMREGLINLMKDGSQEKMLSKMFTRKELYDLIYYDEYESFDRRIAEEVEKKVSRTWIR
ncbi:MAG: methylisocitrate lyase [Aigarchaeota archaeon]|nr:methylisocitrate lyase [Aigarchaeota archaeon]MCX8192886.1 methylisocitrate lyase [Nitrososphaeria archaeon]MDW7986469.1 methylisocitrate lyase [Nitrososphaerota archaeon]